jgi:cystathionine beta-synthase
MEFAETILDLIGETPLLRLGRVTRELGPRDRQPTILAKLEMLNPGGSVKDRIALPMIEAAERDGVLRPGGTIIEPTSGNTGHGLAIAAALKGYRCIFVMADKQSAEKQALLRAYGAEVVLCPTNVPPESPESYYSVAKRLARDIPGAFQPNQYWNVANPEAHEHSTGPEIWRQTEGKVTHLVVASGTGGTISGAGHYLKAQNPAVLVVGADPEGSVLSGDTVRPYLTEGIGEDFLPGTFDASVVDRWVRVSDRDAFAAARRITREEGVLVGESSGTALVAALTVARELMAGAPAGGADTNGAAAVGRASDAVIVVIFPDTGRNYLSKLYNDEWMRQHGLVERPSVPVRIGSVLQIPHAEDLPPLVVARTTDRVGSVIETMQRYGISQLPVAEPDGAGAAIVDAAAGAREGDSNGRVRLDSLVGAISERGLLDRAFRDPAVVDRTVGEVMDPPLPTVDVAASLEDAFSELSAGAQALVAVSGGEPVGVVTRLDLLEHLLHRRG